MKDKVSEWFIYGCMYVLTYVCTNECMSNCSNEWCCDGCMFVPNGCMLY